MTWYALATYEIRGETKPALALDSGLYDFALVAKLAGGGSLAAIPSVGALVAAWPQFSEAVGRVAAEVAAAGPKFSPLTTGVKLAAPFVPTNIFAVASNYIEHANEMGSELAKKADSSPYVFMKATTSVIGPDATVLLPASSKKNDWEVELAAVIGTGGRNIPVAQALGHVAFYTVINDVTSRDGTRREDYPFKHDWFRGKSHDTFAPFGPWLVPAALIGDPQTLALKMAINDETMQDDTTANMIWSVAEQISYVSGITTLAPGDVFATGTPAGVGMGRGIFLKPGDVMTATVEKIGALRNPVAAG